MFERIRRGFAMAGASWAVLKAHPKLVVLPILSTLAFCTLTAAAFLPVVAYYADGQVERLPDTVRADDWALYAAGFAFYVAASFIIVFFNAALVFCALEAFEGRTPTLARGIGAASRRLPQIFAWSLVAATVGLALSALRSFLRDRLGILGAILGGLTEVAWNVVTYFVAPILVVEGVGPIEAIKRSSSVIKKTWGEALSGESGMGFVAFLFMLPAVLVIVAVVWPGGREGASPAIIIGGMTLVALYLLAVALVFAALGAIFRAGAYIYATTGEPPTGVDRALLQTAFDRRRK